MKFAYSKIISVWLLVVISLGACAPAITAPATVVSQQTAKVNVAIFPFLSNAPLFIAQDEGYFAEQNLEVEFINVTSSAQAVPLLVSGEIDVLPAPLTTAFLNAAARGARVRVVADKGRYTPNHCVADALVVRPEVLAARSLNGPADLKGLKLSYNPANYSHYLIETFLKSGGLTLDDVLVVEQNASVGLQAIEQGAIDMTFVSEPSLTRDVAAGQIVIWRTDDQLTTDQQVSLLIYGPSLLDKNPDVGRRFMLAYLKAVKQYQLGATERNLDIAAKYTKQDRELLKKVCWQWITADGGVDLASITHFADWAAEKKFIDTAPALTEVWDSSFIDYANQILQTAP